MNWVNYDDVIAQLQAFGLDTADFEVGKKVRCKSDDSKDKKAGWYWLHELLIDDHLYLVGGFGFWEGNNNHAQKIELTKKCDACGWECSLKDKTCPHCGSKNIKKRQISEDQKKALAKQLAENKHKAEAERNAEIERASNLAQEAWFKLSAEGDCDYLQSKQIDKPAGVKYGNGTPITLERKEFNEQVFINVPNDANSMAIPMRGINGRIYGLQFIRGKNYKGLQKEYWPAGHSKKGKFFTLGAPTPVVLIAEGLATGMTLYMATGMQVLVAFDAGNIQPVAEDFHKSNPRIKLLICADDDYIVRCPNKIGEDKKRCNHVSLAGTETCPACHGNLFYMREQQKVYLGKAGERAAELAAMAVGGAYVLPQFPSDRENKKLTDFNDLASFPNCSLSTVKVQIEDKLTQLGWGTASPLAGAQKQGGGGSDNKGTLKPLIDVPEAVERFSLIYGAGGTMYDHQEAALIPKSDVLDICVDHAWREWKLHPLRSVVRLSEVGFDPTEHDTNIVCNLWGGWPTVPKVGQCDILLNLLRYLCQGEESENSEQVYQWVLKWLAYPIQYHGAKMRTALIFHGPQGAGKNLFFEAYAAIFGKYARIVGQAEIDDKFNDWASGKLFMIADEVVARQELFHIKNKLKALITGDCIRINPKNVAAHDERNHVNLVFLSNEKQPLVLEKDDRRFMVVWTPDKLSENIYADVADEIANGGIAALHDYLLHVDLAGFDPHTKPIMTQSKQDLIDINLESSERFIAEWLSGDLELPVCPCQSEDLYRAYIDWCKRNGVVRPRELNQFIGNIAKTRGFKRERARMHRDFNYSSKDIIQRNVICPPPENYAEKHLREKFKELSHWFTSCVLDFKDGLEGKNHENS